VIAVIAVIAVNEQSWQVLADVGSNSALLDAGRHPLAGRFGRAPPYFV